MRSDGRITREQRRALTAAWLGWAFDGLDGYLYVLVALPFVGELMGKKAPDAEVVAKATLIQAVFLVGWAVGGAVFGRIGDRLGRCRTLTMTILTYALFTGLTFFAQSWWHLLIFRFLAALGIGGEWAAGSALVSETLHRRHRAWGSAVLQSGYQVGCIAASLTVLALAGLPPRWVFLIGVVPAFLTLWIRRAVPEPREWQAEAAQRRVPSVAELFRPKLRWTTLKLMALTSVAMATVWAFLYFVPQAVRKLPEVEGWDAAAISGLVTRVSVWYLCVNIVANFFVCYLAELVGYRRAFFVMMAGALVCYLVGFRAPPTLATIYWITAAGSFFNLGLFGLFPLYIPPLYPTLLRTLGAGFTYNIGRLFAAAGTLLAGQFATAAGGPGGAIWWTSLLFVPGLLICLVIPVPGLGGEAPLGAEAVPASGEAS